MDRDCHRYRLDLDWWERHKTALQKLFSTEKEMIT